MYPRQRYEDRGIDDDHGSVPIEVSLEILCRVANVDSFLGSQLQHLDTDAGVRSRFARSRATVYRY